MVYSIIAQDRDRASAFFKTVAVKKKKREIMYLEAAELNYSDLSAKKGTSERQLKN